MKIAFLGHRDFTESENAKIILQDIFEKELRDKPVEFLFGGYGNFDSFVYQQAVLFKQNNIGRVKLYFITPYIDVSYQQNFLESIRNNYDEIIYPPIESAPKKFAISYRNRYIITQADLIIFFVKHSWGGAAESLKFAKTKKKKFINLAEKI